MRRGKYFLPLIGRVGEEDRDIPQMTLRCARIAKISQYAVLAVCVSILMASGNSCSSNTDSRLKTAGLASPPSISAEQCEALYKIHESATQDSGYIIQQGDQLDVEFYLNSEFNDNVTVDPKGKIALRLVGQLHAA